jgi:type II secretory pathway pseudopilin PulG
MRAARAGLTLLELLVVTVVLGLVGLMLMPLLGPRRGGARHIKDGTQVRAVHQSMVLFANNSRDVYPVPSEMDAANTTLSAGSAKDDLGNVLSVLIYDGYVVPELMVSPAEQSTLIDVQSTYALSDPPAAVNTGSGAGKHARWDPAFRGSPAEQVVQGGTKPLGALAPEANVTAHTSYAMMPFFAARREAWGLNWRLDQAVIGNRGPTYEVVGREDKAKTRLLDTGSQQSSGFVSVRGKGTNSITLDIHGNRKTWEGNIGFNDNHVEFVTQADPPTSVWTFSGLTPASARQRPDNLFVAEDDATVTKRDGTMHAQIGTMQVPEGWGPAATEGEVNALGMSNSWLRTWTVSAVGERGKTTAITVVVD